VPKLIRDLIPEDMRSHGYEPKVRVVDGHEYLAWLLRKLIEEADEVRDGQGCLAELADVYGVLEAIAKATGTTMERVVEAAEAKKARRGGFLCGFLWLDSDSTEGLNRRNAADEYARAEADAEKVGE
jgi:predicted house-cleaning noncanonical NTP pyrophosphatase (MazG superfamily)